MEDHQLQNLVSVWYIREALTQPVRSWNGWFRDHPLSLPLHEQGKDSVDFSVLGVTIPPPLKKRRKTEPDEMLQSLAELCERVGEQIPAGSWRYEWYHLELLDRDGRVAPLCWIDPELLYEFFPEQGQSISQEQFEAMGPQERQEVDWQQIAGAPWSYQLATIDAVARGEAVSYSDQEARKQWREWLVGTWREREQHWLQEGRLTYETVRPWSQMLAFDPALLEAEYFPAEWTQEENPDVSPGRLRSWAGYPGLYWRQIPLYDGRSLSLVWHAMREEMYVTSVFNVAAKQEQDPRLWKVLEQRFVLPFQRLSHYQYLVRRREKKVLEWSRDDGKSLTEIAKLLVDTKLYPLDPQEAARVSSMEPEDKWQHYANARREAVRILKRLRDEGLVQRGRPGRRPKRDDP